MKMKPNLPLRPSREHKTRVEQLNPRVRSNFSRAGYETIRHHIRRGGTAERANIGTPLAAHVLPTLMALLRAKAMIIVYRRTQPKHKDQDDCIGQRSLASWPHTSHSEQRHAYYPSLKCTHTKLVYLWRRRLLPFRVLWQENRIAGPSLSSGESASACVNQRSVNLTPGFLIFNFSLLNLSPPSSSLLEVSP